MTSPNDDQRVFWEIFAQKWVSHQAELDAAFAPVLDGVVSRAGLKAGMNVLDIGCGTGTSTLRAAALVEPNGKAVGIDISDPMLAHARTLAADQPNVHFETADAAEHRFARQSFDAVISRFGVMFFVEPVKAFANIRRALKPGATVSMAAWSVLDANPWFQVPMRAAKKRLGAPPSQDPDAPGPLAFRNPDRVVGILEAAGFSTVTAETMDLKFTPEGALRSVARQAAYIGPAARTLEYFEGSEADFEAIVDDVALDFAVYDTPDGVRVPAQINFFTATAP